MTIPIEETPMPLAAWKDGDTASPIEAVSADVGSLLRELAELKLAAGEAKREEDKRLEKLLLEILAAIDGFERVFRAVQAKESEVTKQMKIWLGNFRTIRRLLDNILDAHGVTPIVNVDQGFDPQWHKAVETVADPSRTDGTIVEELRKGYLRGTSILRKSEVVVVKNE
jgi:molecular chaperone GrpE (heat shock protein)